jgi:hypothetical protein
MTAATAFLNAMPDFTNTGMTPIETSVDAPQGLRAALQNAPAGRQPLSRGLRCGRREPSADALHGDGMPLRSADGGFRGSSVEALSGGCGRHEKVA